MTLPKDRKMKIDLGGISALMGDDRDDEESQQQVPLSSIRLPDQQPRRYFDPQKLEQLATSIKQHGILEPLLVRPLRKGEYELVAGERRYRAAQEIGMETVPIVVKKLNDDEALQLALIENLQREDLNPYEEVEGILQLLSLRLGKSSDEAASLLYRLYNEEKGNVNPNVRVSGKKKVEEVFEPLDRTWQSFVKNQLPLLKLPDDIKIVLRQGQLAYTKAKEIAKVKDEAAQETLLKDSIAQSLSLTQIKDRVKALRPPKKSDEGLQSRWDSTLKRFKKAKPWDDPKRSKKFERLLEQMDKLLEEE